MHIVLESPKKIHKPLASSAVTVPLYDENPVVLSIVY